MFVSSDKHCSCKHLPKTQENHQKTILSRLLVPMAHASFAALHSNGWTNFGICERGTRHERSQAQSLDLPSSLALRKQFCPVVNIRKRLRHVRYSCWSRNNRRFQLVGAGKPGCLQSAGSSSIVGLWHVLIRRRASSPARPSICGTATAPKSNLPTYLRLRAISAWECGSRSAPPSS